MGINVEKMIVDVIEEASKKAVAIRRRAEILKQLEAKGITIKYPEGVVKYGFAADVSRSDLTAIRGIVGRLTMVGKDCAWNFKDTNELEVSLEPVNKDMPIRFTYRTKYRKGGKCRVVEHVSSPSVHSSLVCDR